MSRTISFTDNSSNAFTWLWDFGDGNTSTEQNPIHTFETFGSYMVRLTVTDGMGNADETQQFIEITSGGQGDTIEDTQQEQQEEQQQEQQEEQQEEQQTDTQASDWPDFLSLQGINSLQDLEARFGIITLESLEMMVEVGVFTQEQSNIISELAGLTSYDGGSTTPPPSSPTTQTYTLTGTLTKFGTSSEGPFSISRENYPTLLSDISVGSSRMSVDGIPGEKVIVDFNLSEKTVSISPGIMDSFYGETYSFSMTIVSEQIGLQPEDTSENTGGDTGDDNGDTGGDDVDSGGGYGDRPGPNRP